MHRTANYSGYSGATLALGKQLYLCLLTQANTVQRASWHKLTRFLIIRNNGAGNSWAVCSLERKRIHRNNNSPLCAT